MKFLVLQTKLIGGFSTSDVLNYNLQKKRKNKITHEVTNVLGLITPLHKKKKQNLRLLNFLTYF